MNKSSVIGLILIGVIFFGFTWYQSKQYQKQVEFQAQQDSIALAQKMYMDSVWRAEHPADTAASFSMQNQISAENTRIYKDSLIDNAHKAEASYYTLSNDRIEVAFTTKGAQPYSVKLKDFYNYDSTDLYIFKPEMSQYGITIYAGENINTKDFVFEVAEKTDSTIVMRLPFAGGGYLQQKYILAADSFVVDNEFSMVGMGNVIPRNVSAFDIDWNVIIPRMEKGYRNEKQYSKLNYLFPGEKKPERVGVGRDDDARVDAKISWFAFQQQFFSAIMRAENDFSSGDMAIRFCEENDPDRNLMACTAKMRSEFTPSPDGSVSVPFSFYFGPNHYRTLKHLDQHYERIIPLGGSVIGLISRGLIIPVFNFLGRFIGNFGIVILILTVLIKLIVSPLTVKSYISSAKMSVIKPEVDKLNQKYPKQEDALKKQQAMMDLYRRAGISPMGGCLPMLLQLPVLYAMFRFFPASIELRQQHFLWADDLSGYDSILDLPFNIPLYGDHISLFALLMAVSMFLYSKMTSSQMSDDPNMAGMKFMSVWMMPVMMLFICNNLSSGLSYYYLLSNLITMLQTWFVKRYIVKPEKIYAQLAASAHKPAPKSKWQQRLEEAQRMQQQMAKEQAKKRR